jgi:hypothetical protein
MLCPLVDLSIFGKENSPAPSYAEVEGGGLKADSFNLSISTLISFAAS